MARGASRPTRRRTRSSPPSTRAACAGELPARLARDRAVDAAVAAHAKAETVASRKASQLALEAFTKALPELLGGSADLTGSNLTNTSSTPPLRFDADGAISATPKAGRPPHQLRRARVRHGRDHERHRAARRLHPLRRHLPDLQRLQPQRDPHGRADEAARDPRLHARLDRPRRGRPDAPVDRARGVAAPDPEPRRLAPVRHARDAGRLGLRDREPRAARRALLLSRQNLPYAPKPAFDADAPEAPSARSPRAPTCWPSRPRSACAAGRRR